MTIDVATGIARILKQEGVEWVSTFPVCRVNNALGREGVPIVMMRDDRYAVALADAFSRINAGAKIGVCTFQGGVNAAGLQVAYAGMAQAFEDGSPVLCITDGVPIGATENSQFDVTSSLKSVSKWYGYLDKPERLPEFMRRAFTMYDEIRFGPGAGTGGSGGSGATFNVDLRGADKDAVIRLEKFVKALDANFEKRSVSAVQQARFANPRLFG